MEDAGKATTGGDRRQNARFPAKTKWKAATPGLETAVFGYRASFTPGTFVKAYGSSDEHTSNYTEKIYRNLKMS